MSASTKVKVAIIGGTGLYDIENVETVETVWPETPWGKPSDEITIARYSDGSVNGQVAFLPRHGRGHFVSPTMIPQKANIAALKMLGVEQVLAFSAVGSLKEEIPPKHFVLPDQIIDRTRHRPDTFYDEGIVVHVSFGDPYCPRLYGMADDAMKELKIDYHTGETVICMEGPQFSTRAESKLYKSWGAGIINMSALPEAKLAREMELCYQVICMSTDYDSWREQAEAVTADEIMQVIHENSAQANRVLQQVLPELLAVESRDCACKDAVKYGVITAAEQRPPAVQKKLNNLLPGIF